MKINFDRIAVTLFGFSIIFLAFGYGVVAHRYNLFPYPVLHDAVKVLKNQYDNIHLEPIRHENAGTVVIDRDAIAPGVVLITTYWPEFDWMAGINLIDIDGKVLHHWDTNPLHIWPDDPYDDAMTGAMAGAVHSVNNYVHGSYLFPNGDVLLNIEYLGLARIDACGRVLWKLSYRTHHSIAPDQNGDFWVSGIKWVDSGSERAAQFPGLKAPFGEDTVLKISPNGEILQELSILDALYNGGYQHLFWKHDSREGDLTHINDVEPLSSDIADMFPGFDAGDLLISLKHISTVAIMDQSGKIKWLDSQSFQRQHDPDFEKNGWLVVFDNREDGTTTGKYLGGSKISAIKPSSAGSITFYPPSAKSKLFYSNAGGKHQLLDNGNRLITESMAARILEVDQGGRIIWEWVHQPYDDEMVPQVMEGTKYDIEPEVISGWQCN